MLLSSEPAHGAPRRIAVAGVSGTGKTTLSRAVSARLGVPHVETDGLHHGPAWTPRPEFLDDVRRAVAGEAWVMEWQYATARPVIAARAQLLVWLDHPTRVTMTRVVRRTLRRRLRREVLWNGNQEPPLRTILRDPEHILRWAWSTRHKYRDGAVAEAARAHPDLVVVRLRSQRDVRRWLASLPAEPPQDRRSR